MTPSRHRRTSYRKRRKRPAILDPAAPSKTASFPVNIRDRGLLDHEAALRGDDHKSRVIEVARTSSLHTRADRLEQPSAQPHDVLPRAQRNPEEIHGCGWLARLVCAFAILGAHADSKPEGFGADRT